MIRIKKIIVFALLIPFIIAKAGAVNVSAHSAILYDPLSEKALYEKDADTRRSMASTTKIMTAVCALENCKPLQLITIKKEYTGVEGSSMYLQPGEQITLEGLLHGLLLLSGNDAAQAIAGYLSGSNSLFAKRMNEKAQELNLTNTNFENPSGLDGENHYTTARDLARLAAYAMDLPEFREIVQKKHYSTGTRSMKNHNRLLWEYSGADGVKTGFTKKSGRCLVSSAEKNDRRLIAVTLNAPNDWSDHRTLLDYGFSSFTDTVIAKEHEPVLSVPVISGISEGVAVYCPEEIIYPLADEEKELVKREFLGRKFVYAPIKAGMQYGTVRFTLYGKVIKETPIYFLDSVPLKEVEKPRGLFEKIAKFFGF
ncbi:MAG: D-alanyl-D-alanine carboxypeptidase [Clostridiales bacterium]|nr:D-alanyl-D-alanine carboxypeptidase [Clostridiales bacterium]